MRPIQICRLHSQRGVAAVVAILVVALTASTATYLLWQQSLAIRQMENIAVRAQADTLARSGAIWAASFLFADTDRAIDHLGELWATRAPPFETEGVLLAGAITDEQGKFNINNLATAPPSESAQPSPELDAFRRLLGVLMLPPALADAVADWLDADTEARGNGAEDTYYLALDPPYRTANQMITDTSELRRVKGFDDEIMKKLEPFITALPRSTAVNINTAPAEVLRAVMPNLSAGDVGTLIESRLSKPFKDIADIEKRYPKPASAQGAQSPPSARIDVKSNYFSAAGTVKAGRVIAGYRAILERPELSTAQAKSWPRIISLSDDPY